MDQSMPSAQPTGVPQTPPATSYVDRYQPPVTTVSPITMPPADPAATTPEPMPTPATPPTTPVPAAPESLVPSTPPAESAAPTATVAPVSAAPSSPSSVAATEKKDSQSLEDQNIFHLLGVEDAKDDEKESFLDELQQIIWEDFLENDVELLLTEEELKEFKVLSDKTYPQEDDRQSAMVEYLEKFIPDLEKIMLEKALELKEEMMRERMKEMLELHANTPEKLTKVKNAQELADRQQWRDAANVLNSL